ncbi:MAG: ABC transporter permease [Lachnospiraceae bacterium]|nr:ABC transporter permease [Lachnospiraceae bacterium]MDD7326295.1 ABC transporter permease [Lachnospiraceae bacterium]MDY2759754.1 ABC transporter permease [Lachnospiraceae bacterium]
MVKSSIKMALNSVFSNKLRSFLTMLGIIIGVVALVVLVSITTSATSTITDTISEISTNSITVTITDDKDNPLKLSDMDDIAELDDVAAVAPSAVSSANVKNGSDTETMKLTGTTASYQVVNGTELASGRFLKSADVDNHSNVAVINADTARDILGVYNTQQAIGKTISLNEMPYTVIGVIKQSDTTVMLGSSYEAYIPFTSLERLATTVRDISSFSVAPKSDAVSDKAQQEIDEYLLARFSNDSDAFTVINMKVIADTLSKVTDVMALMLGGIAAISLLVGGIGIMNIMLVSVTERTKEIGIRKAIGATEGSIMLQFLIEALVICLIGAVIGLVISGIIIAAINAFTEYSFRLNPTVCVVASVFSIGIGLLFGLYPAKKAAGKDPIEALHYAG